MKKHAMMAAVLFSAGMLAGCSSSSSSNSTTQSTTASTQEETSTEEAADESVAESTDSTAEAETEGETETADEYVELDSRPTYTALDYVTLGEYTGLAVEVDPVAEVTEEDVDSAVESAVESAGLYDTLTEGTVQEGDIANIDYVGTKDGEEFDGGSAEGYDLTIGSGTFIDGFEDGLIGVAIGETVDLNLTFPESYGNEDLAGQDVVFTVTVNSIQRMPEITDDVINELTDGEYTTVDAYRIYQEEQLKESAESTQTSAINNELMTQLYNTCEVTDYPQDLVDYSIQEMNNYYIQYASYYGMTLNDFITTYFGMDRDTYDEQGEAAVKSSIEQELILVAIAEAEGLDLTDEEYEEGCQNYAEQMGYESVEDFQAAYDENKIRASLMMDRAMDFVRENAVITETSEEETEAVSEAPAEAVTEAAEETEAVSESAETEAAQTEAVTEAVTE